MKQKGEVEGGEDKSEEEGEWSEIMAMQCVDTLQDYMCQKGSRYSHITAARKIHTAVRNKLNSSQKQATITNCFSE